MCTHCERTFAARECSRVAVRSTEQASGGKVYAVQGRCSGIAYAHNAGHGSTKSR